MLSGLRNSRRWKDGSDAQVRYLAVAPMSMAEEDEEEVWEPARDLPVPA
jgi:hypothetical protein